MTYLQKSILQIGKWVFRNQERGVYKLSKLCAPFMPKDLVHTDMGGYSLTLDLRHPGDLIRAWGAWEVGLHNYLKRALEPGMTFVDVGAHHGTYAALALSMGATVHAFEPYPESIEILKKSAPNAAIHPIAESDTNGISHISASGPHLMEDGDISIKTGRIDDYVEHADVVKIDTDGSEDKVLRGMPRLLEQGVTVIVEISDFDYQPFKESLAQLSEPLSAYEPYLIRRDGTLGPLEITENQIHVAYLPRG